MTSGSAPRTRDDVELQPVHEVQAHRVDDEHMHRIVGILGRARCGVVVAVAAKYRYPPFREEFQGRWMQPGSRIRGVPRPRRFAAAAVADPDEEQIAPFDTDSCAASAGRLVPTGTCA